MKKRNRRVNKAKLAKRERRIRDKAWREAVLARDKVCVICGRDFMTNIHHIVPREVKAFRTDVGNGVALCPKHHRFSLECSPHKNSFVFMLWLQKFRPDQCKYLINRLRELSMMPWKKQQ